MTTETKSSREIPPGVRKLFYSLVFGGLGYAITNTPLISISQIWNVLAAIVISGVALLAQFFIEFDQRLATVEEQQRIHHAKMLELIEDEFSKINEATELFALVETSVLRTDSVTQLVRNSTKIRPDAPGIVSGLAQAEVSRVSHFLRELGDGATVAYDGEDRDWLLALADSVQETLDATSLTTVDAGGTGFDGGFWLTDLGQRYLDSQSDAVRRGVKIRRAFILDRAEIVDDVDFIRMCQLQQDVGIEVRVLDPHVIIGTQRSSLFDFVLFDNMLSYEVTPASRITDDERPTIVNTRLVLQGFRIKDRVRHFNGLWESASPFIPRPR
jgi:hypothetical protein